MSNLPPGVTTNTPLTRHAPEPEDDSHTQELAFEAYQQAQPEADR